MAQYVARLAARISKDTDERLRMLVLLRCRQATRRVSLSRVLTEVLDGALPSAAELADQMRGAVTNDQH
jgi:hypothetical protein